jgi:hypothetical protein
MEVVFFLLGFFGGIFFSLFLTKFLVIKVEKAVAKAIKNNNKKTDDDWWKHGRSPDEEDYP